LDETFDWLFPVVTGVPFLFVFLSFLYLIMIIILWDLMMDNGLMMPKIDLEGRGHFLLMI